jgi:hypothetical protein
VGLAKGLGSSFYVSMGALFPHAGKKLQSITKTHKLPTPTIRANICHASLYESAVRAMRKKTEIKFPLAARNAKEAMVAPMVGSGGFCVWWDSGNWCLYRAILTHSCGA